MKKKYKIVMYVPESHSEILRNAIGKVGAGIIGNYTYCTFTTKGIGRFKPHAGSNPSIGEVGKLEEVEEERIETVCSEDKLMEVMKAIKAVHPYEEPATDVFPIELFE